MSRPEFRSKGKGRDRKVHPVHEPSGYAPRGQGSPTADGITREDLRAQRSASLGERPSASKRFRISPRTREGAQGQKITSPTQPFTPVISEKPKDWDQEADNKELNKRVLDPTNPQHLVMWHKDPDRYDMADVDTPFRDEDVITIFRGVRGKWYMTWQKEEAEDLPVGMKQVGGVPTVHDLHVKGRGLGEYWTGNLQVARIYGHGGVTSLVDPGHLKHHDEGVDKLIHNYELRLEREAKADKARDPPYWGCVFKWDAKGRNIGMYNPEAYPMEMEARLDDSMKPKSVEDMERPMSQKYPGIELGFIQKERRVEWHKIEERHESMKLDEIVKEKPYRVENVRPVREIETPDSPDRYYVVGKSPGVVSVATGPKGGS